MVSTGFNPLSANRPVVNSPSAALAPGRVLAAIKQVFINTWRGLLSRLHHPTKLLSVVETVSLGDRRSIAVVQFERQRYLVACAATSVTLLARLPDCERDAFTSSSSLNVTPSAEVGE